MDVMDPVPLSWGDLRAQRCTDVPVLILRQYNLGTLFSACREGVWQPQELSIHPNNDVNAVLRTRARECRMLSFRSAPVDAAVNVQRLISKRAYLSSLERLELSHPLSIRQGQRHQLMPLPSRSMPALTTLVLLFAGHENEWTTYRPATSRKGAVLYPDALSTCGKLRTANLTTLVLKYHPLRDGPDVTGVVVHPLPLAEFIGGHIKLAGHALLPELRIDSPRLRLVDDAAGMADLTGNVGTIIYGL